jgi:hypothetical protein
MYSCREISPLMYKPYIWLTLRVLFMSNNLYRKEMDRQLNVTRKVFSLIFPRSYHQSAWAFYNVKVSPYVPNPIRCFKCQKFGRGKGKLKCLSVERNTTRVSTVITIRGAPIVVNLVWFHRKIVNITWKKKRSKKLYQKKISHTLRRADSSAANDSPVQKSYASVAKRVFNSVETQNNVYLDWKHGKANSADC